jgi:16S rRNA processing protein RimM
MHHFLFFISVNTFALKPKRMTNYCSIGKWVATFGVNGELVLKHHLGKKTSLKGLEVLFIEMKKNEMLPYFIERVKIKNEEEVYVKLESVDVKETAQLLTQKEVWLTEEAFHKYSAKTAPISFLGYTLVNEGAVLGEVLEVIEQPHQLLCRIHLDSKEAFIPVHPDNLQRVDKKKKQLHVVLPEGLLDVYR